MLSCNRLYFIERQALLEICCGQYDFLRKFVATRLGIHGIDSCTETCHSIEKFSIYRFFLDKCIDIARSKNLIESPDERSFFIV